MNNLLRGLIAGYGAKKLGGGCFGTIIVFILIWVALGQCSWTTIDTSESHENKYDHIIKIDSDLVNEISTKQAGLPATRASASGPVYKIKK